MNEESKNNQTQTCPQCDNHCPVDALKCGNGRKYFGMTDGGHDGEHNHEHSHERGCGHSRLGGLAGLLHQCGRFVRHADMEEAELFQALTGEEKTALQSLLEKLAANWQERYGEDSGHRCGHGHHDHKEGKHHQHEAHGK